MSAKPGVALVTGAGRGIGLAIATALAGDGWHVAVADLDVGAAEKAAVDLPGECAGFAVDVADHSSVAALVHDVEERFGPLDLLVNNAGVMWVGPFDEEPEAASRRMLEVNLIGVINGFRVVAPLMRARGHGHILTIASAASRLAPPGEATYAASKHGVLGYATAVRRELKGSGVEVSLICPVVVRTELAAGTSSGAAPTLRPEQVAKSVMAVVRRPRFVTYVPRHVTLLTTALAVLPQRARDWLSERTVPDQVRSTDRSKRTDYERGLTGRDGP
ncbi:MAG TPA: SDR family oxidoreductase [Mycobacteriales bacterium]|nr:SDR family oxidoreductase [Mycobacteriales bacterium]